MKVKANMRDASHNAAARAPRRRRGEARVAALLESATELFVEKGYDATTMTEVAAHAGAAIGSLYQFFPSKDALAAALLDRYGEWMEQSLAELVRAAESLSPGGLIDELIARRLERRPEREAVMALTDAPIAAGARARFSESINRHLAAALVAVNPQLTKGRAGVMASVVIQVLRLVPVRPAEGRRQQLQVIREMREMLTLYVEHAQS